MNEPHLTFFCELDSQSLQALFSRPEVTAQLKALHAGVSLGLLDLSQERADIVRCLNQEGIPVTAWLLLPKEQGYWFNLDNAPQAAAQYEAFKSWTVAHGLQWSGVGLDIEPDINAVQDLAQDRRAGIRKIAAKLFQTAKARQAAAEYRSLVARIRTDGYCVESYQIPFLIDDRKAGSTVLQRLAGLVDLNVDQEVLMLYTSFMRPFGAGVLWNYAGEAGGIGVGNVGGGVKIEGVLEPEYLSWGELQRDLLLAYQHTRHIYIFSLEGCVERGFMERIVDFQWHQPVRIPLEWDRKVGRVRILARTVLWMAAHPLAVLGAGLVLAWAFRRRRA